MLALLIAIVLQQAPAADEATLTSLINRAVDNARRYTDTLRNLTAQETRTTELFDKSSKLDRQRVTIADVVVHQAGADTLAEYRRVREVDGKPVKTRQESLDSFLRTLQDAASVTRELELIQQESARYDLETMRMRGMMLNQAWPLEDENFRRRAVFSVQGTESVEGRSSTIVRYEAPSALSETWRVGDLADMLKTARVYSRGRIWIDAATAEIWRYESETLVEESTLAEPAILDRMTFEYRPSRFGAPTPQKIVWESYARATREKGKLKLSIRGRVTANYGPFQSFGADVKIVPLGVQ